MKAFERVLPLAVTGAMALGFSAACSDGEAGPGIPPPEINPVPPAAAEPFSPSTEIPGESVYDVLDDSRMIVAGAVACLAASRKTGSMITADYVSYSNEPYARGKDGRSNTSDDRLFFSASRDTITNVLTYRISQPDNHATTRDESGSVEVKLWSEPSNPALIDGNAVLTRKQIKDAGLDPAATPNGMTIADRSYSESIVQRDVDSISEWDLKDPTTGLVSGEATFMDADGIRTSTVKLLKRLAKTAGVKNCA